MKTKTVNLYTFDELSDGAKEKARDWWRQHVFSDSSDWEFVFEDAIECAKILGIEIASHSVPLMNGKTRQEPSIYFSGFSSQGDGASFEGSYQYAKGAAKKIRQHAPQDKELHRIADELQHLQKKHFYRLLAQMKVSGRYSHSGCMAVDVTGTQDCYGFEDQRTEEVFTELMRDFADWIYRQLENEYNYQTSDEVADEALLANGYTFLADGTRED